MASQLRILHVTPYFRDAWAYGGIPRAVAALADAQAQLGHRVTVATTDVKGRGSRLPDAPPSKQDEGTPEVAVFRNLSNRLAYEWQLFLPMGLRSYLRERVASFDVVHAHALHNVPSVLAARATARAHRPLLLQPHGTAPLIERRRLAKWLFDRTVGRGLHARVDRWIAISEAEREQFLQLAVPAEQIRVVPPAMELARPNGEPVRPDVPEIVFLGRLSPRKRVDLLIQAFARLPRGSARLVIAGPDMGTEPLLRGLVEQAGLQGSVTFLGVLEGRARLELLARAAVVAYGGRDEALGLVPLEALLCGTPVVVANDSGCGATIGRLGGGIVFTEGDEAALTAALQTILADRDGWRQRARTASESVRREFGAEAVARQMDSVMAELRPS